MRESERERERERESVVRPWKEVREYFNVLVVVHGVVRTECIEENGGRIPIPQSLSDRRLQRLLANKDTHHPGVLRFVSSQLAYLYEIRTSKEMGRVLVLE